MGSYQKLLVNIYHHKNENTRGVWDMSKQELKDNVEIIIMITFVLLVIYFAKEGLDMIFNMGVLVGMENCK